MLFSPRLCMCDPPGVVGCDPSFMEGGCSGRSMPGAATSSTSTILVAVLISCFILVCIVIAVVHTLCRAALAASQVLPVTPPSMLPSAVLQSPMRLMLAHCTTSQSGRMAVGVDTGARSSVGTPTKKHLVANTHVVVVNP